MSFVRKYRWIVAGVGLLIVLIAFLAVRPDKLFVDDAVDESLSDAFASTSVTTTMPLPATSDPLPSSGTPATTTTSPQAAPSQTPSSDPAVISTGEFFGIDHSAGGTATVYEQDGKQILRFEDDTNIQNGPDLYVWILAGDGYEGGTPTEYIDLGKIKGNVGGQNYELPPEYDPAVYKTVLIWCLRFSTPFAAAPLS